MCMNDVTIFDIRAPLVLSVVVLIYLPMLACVSMA
jgi:hypothetical protein